MLMVCGDYRHGRIQEGAKGAVAPPPRFWRTTNNVQIDNKKNWEKRRKRKEGREGKEMKEMEKKTGKSIDRISWFLNTPLSTDQILYTHKTKAAKDKENWGDNSVLRACKNTFRRLTSGAGDLGGQPLLICFIYKK